MKKKFLHPKERHAEQIAVFQSENAMPLYPNTQNCIYLSLGLAGKITVKEMLDMLWHGEVDLENLDFSTVLTCSASSFHASGRIKADELWYDIAFTKAPILTHAQSVRNGAIFSRDITVSEHTELNGNCIVAGRVVIDEGATLTIGRDSCVTVQDMDLYGTLEVYGTMSKDRSEELEQNGREEEKELPSFLYVTGGMNLLGDGAAITQMGMTVITELNVWANASYSGWYAADCMRIAPGKVLRYDHAWGEIQELHMSKASVMELIDSESVIMTCGHDFSKGFQDQKGMGVCYAEDGVTLCSGEGNQISYVLLGNVVGSLPRMEGGICVLDANGFVGNQDDMDNIIIGELTQENASETPTRYRMTVREKEMSYPYAVGKAMTLAAAMQRYLDMVLPDHGDLRSFEDCWYGCGDWDCSVDWHYKREEAFKKNARYVITLTD